MLVAVLSDIHANPFALRAVMRDIALAGAGEIWVGGDTFGYYPWAADTFSIIDAHPTVVVRGNHDHWILDAEAAPPGLLGEIARRNAQDLVAHAPEALAWLASLAPSCEFERHGWKVCLVHGTPDDPLEGRYYPDDTRPHAWLPQAGQILIMGQTHYPILRGTASAGLTLNPGSVGQSRDGNPMPSWALLDLETGRAELRRTAYANGNVMARLRQLEWHEPITQALDKRARRA